jgi:acyl carrier protein
MDEPGVFTVLEDVEHAVMQFVASQTAVRAKHLTLATRLLHDIGVDGADGWELMTELGRKFGVDMSEFESVLHFGPEASCNPISLLWGLLEGFPQFVPITVGDLVEAAQTRKWRTPNRPPV